MGAPQTAAEKPAPASEQRIKAAPISETFETGTPALDRARIDVDGYYVAVRRTRTLMGELQILLQLGEGASHEDVERLARRVGRLYVTLYCLGNDAGLDPRRRHPGRQSKGRGR